MLLVGGVLKARNVQKWGAWPRLTDCSTLRTAPMPLFWSNSSQTAKPMYMSGSGSESDLAFPSSSRSRKSTTCPVCLARMAMGETVSSKCSDSPSLAIDEANVAKMESRMVLPTRRKATPQRRGSLSMSMIGASVSTTVDLRDPRPLRAMYSECPPAIMSRQASA